jgi:hypothetical protein
MRFARWFRSVGIFVRFAITGQGKRTGANVKLKLSNSDDSTRMERWHPPTMLSTHSVEIVWW